MRKPILVLMTRWPAPKRCKTRLSKDIGPYKAARIQRQLTNHTIAVAKKLSEKGILDIKLAVDGIGNKKIATWARSKGISQAGAQGLGNLGVKMKRQLVLAQRKSSAGRAEPRDTILIGTDVPSLCQSDIDSAVNYLARNDLVIGPAKDGGYWLIAFSKNILSPIISWPFTGINWGTSSVFKETLRRADLEGLKHKSIVKRSDLDVEADLFSWHS
ncbi:MULTISPECIES: TIGR04282 family arsenosugar biosynthesis glycosyltransferase [unclassified Prochlorococcus]|uniref:TIGR04282 family arsenosugar biosynthesis glycosyltransferase n=1 Tax=unclassified Prochlorococcus TaxID=2627481 RepID=UPI0005337B83|nr:MULTISPECIES: TIGR04282 family arsenosugar biosynthesis glycosyltransferase [unclassified Prochlorococcus]KGG17132.1 hypothetical protein EV07_0565 [Prochlorococcus sp. MIT 0603]